MIKKDMIVSGLRISYLISQDFHPERARVFLPGWKSPVDLFCGVAHDLDNLVAVNLPGWGGSERPSTDWGLAQYADFLKEFLDKLGISRPVLIGHSGGAAIAAEFLSRGGLASKLVIIGGAIIREKSAKVRMLAAASRVFRFLFPFVNQKWRRRLAGKSLSPDYVQAGDMVGIYRRLINEDRQESFAQLDLPIALIWGENDADTPVGQARRLHSLNKRAELFIIPQAGHYVFLDQPEVFREKLSSIL